MKTQLDKFTRAYIQTALWSSNGPAFGSCPCCEEEKLLTHYPEAEYEQTPMCDAPGCGVTQTENDDPLDSNYSEDDITRKHSQAWWRIARNSRPTMGKPSKTQSRLGR